MSLKRSGSWLAAWVLVLAAASPGTAQPPEGYVVGDMQLFASGEQATLGGGPRANQGAFFTMNGRYWTIQAPEVSTIGMPSTKLITWAPGSPAAEYTANQLSNENTGFIKNGWSGGDEITLGFIRDHEGIQFSYFYLHGNTQEETKPWVQVFYEDASWGKNAGHLVLPVQLIPGAVASYPVEYSLMTVRNQSKISGVGLDYMYRDRPGMAGGIFEWTLGAKYVEFYENFDVDAIGGLLDETHARTWAYNRIVGPDVGLRWFRRSDRWTVSVMGDFIAGANFQAVRQKGELASLSGNAISGNSNLLSANGTAPPSLRALSFDHFNSIEEFSPVVQLKFELKWQATRAVAFNVGWSGMWMDNIARPSGMVDWTLGSDQTLGILADQNRQHLFLQGLVAGVEINR